VERCWTAFAIGLSLVGFQGALAQSEPPSPGHVKELYFDAARTGRVDLLDGLIKAGMNPNEHDPRGFTPLILAAYNGHAQAVDFLIAKGADPCATDPKGNNALMGVAFKASGLKRDDCCGSGAAALPPGAAYRVRDLQGFPRSSLISGRHIRPVRSAAK
jgi:ankyrin repeat protein